MFSSIQFSDAIDSYQMLLGEGIFDPSFSGDEEWKKVKMLALTDFTKCKWLECYKQQKVSSFKLMPKQTSKLPYTGPINSFSLFRKRKLRRLGERRIKVDQKTLPSLP